jgi:hypothetical protein
LTIINNLPSTSTFLCGHFSHPSTTCLASKIRRGGECLGWYYCRLVWTFLLARYLGAELLGHVVTLGLISCGTRVNFLKSKSQILFLIPVNEWGIRETGEREKEVRARNKMLPLYLCEAFRYSCQSQFTP